MAYLPERKKSKLKSGRVFKYNNARERDTERGDWKRVGGSAKSVPSVSVCRRQPTNCSVSLSTPQKPRGEGERMRWRRQQQRGKKRSKQNIWPLLLGVTVCIFAPPTVKAKQVATSAEGRSCKSHLTQILVDLWYSQTLFIPLNRSRLAGISSN